MEKITKFQQRFNECLKYSDIKQTELAKAAHVSKQCISDYKSGKSVPTTTTFFLICKSLKFRANTFLGLENKKGGGGAAVMRARPSVFNVPLFETDIVFNRRSTPQVRPK